ncbi:uncharacterized protein LOC122652116 [Telopea speciosissima]|uniref:uncharacterized protein LOC122652116 n=1 Tax=Telopea speciosissima TaxID=54955 RepID=UPI001CC6292D|nr:uncharacterized protein LOC122652116 [Telopea speciosissima]
MEGKKQVGSSSSFPSDLFGTKESSPPSKGVFGSVFPPASKMVGRDSSNSELLGYLRKQDSGKDVLTNKHGSGPDSSNGQGRELGNKSSSIPNTDSMSSNFYQDESMGPCYLSSSLYYGGQDIYSNSSSTTRPSSGSTTPVHKQDGPGDDPNENNLDSASRGNWWQGSLYY